MHGQTDVPFRSFIKIRKHIHEENGTFHFIVICLVPQFKIVYSTPQQLEDISLSTDGGK